MWPRRASGKKRRQRGARSRRFEVRGFLAFGGPPRRHGRTQRGKLVRLDPGTGPGTDFEQILKTPILARRRARSTQGGPRRPKMGAETAQEGPESQKSTPGGPQEAPSRPQDSTGRPQEPPGQPDKVTRTPILIQRPSPIASYCPPSSSSSSSSAFLLVLALVIFVFLLVLIFLLLVLLLLLAILPLSLRPPTFSLLFPPSSSSS